LPGRLRADRRQRECWTGLNPASGVPTAHDPVTSNQLGRIDIAIAPSNPNYIYAQVQSIKPNPNGGCGNTNGCQLGAYRTTDGGVTWSLVPGSPGASLENCTASSGDYAQNWYDQGIAVDRTFPDARFLTLSRSGCGLIRARYGLIPPAVTGRKIMASMRSARAAFVPGSSTTLLAGNDGGVHGTVTALDPGPTWFNMDTGLNTIEFYSGDISGDFANSPTPQANGGPKTTLQFRHVLRYPTGPAQWQMGKGGDGFYGRIDPVGTGSNLRFWQGNNSVTCTAASAPVRPRVRAGAIIPAAG